MRSARSPSTTSINREFLSDWLSLTAENVCYPAKFATSQEDLLAVSHLVSNGFGARSCNALGLKRDARIRNQ